MKKIFLYLLILVGIPLFFCCNSKLNPYITVTVKYFANSEDGEYEIKNDKIKILAGQPMETEDSRVLKSKYNLAGFSASKFFIGSDSRENSFSEKKDYKTPAEMPAPSKLGDTYFLISDAVFFKNTTLYVYYSISADKEYDFDIKCLNFSHVDYGVEPSVDTVRIHFDAGEELSVDAVKNKLREITESDLPNASHSMSGGKILFTIYDCDGIYELPNEDYNYNFKTAVYDGKLARSGNLIENEFKSITSEANQTYCLRYSLNRSTTRKVVEINYISNALNRAIFSLDVDENAIYDPVSLLSLTNYIKDNLINGKTITLSNQYTINKDRFYSFKKLVPTFERIGRTKISSTDFKYNLPSDVYDLNSTVFSSNAITCPDVYNVNLIDTDISPLESVYANEDLLDREKFNREQNIFYLIYLLEE